MLTHRSYLIIITRNFKQRKAGNQNIKETRQLHRMEAKLFEILNRIYRKLRGKIGKKQKYISWMVYPGK